MNSSTRAEERLFLRGNRHTVALQQTISHGRGRLSGRSSPGTSLTALLSGQVGRPKIADIDPGDVLSHLGAHQSHSRWIERGLYRPEQEAIGREYSWLIGPTVKLYGRSWLRGEASKPTI
ncbi:MAG: hypothetical protein VR78_16945 [Hoeflea sp. BRH_c9]|nr:MAG: hypothetical protein VR78_16945 [Hoeflea sp. BRH_c9]